MTSIIYDNQLRIIEFQPDFSKFKELSNIFFQTSQAHKSKWFRITKVEAESYLMAALHTYAVLNLRQYHIEIGKYNRSLDDLKEVLPNIPVPRFFRDVFREFVRPMEDGVDIYIPSFSIPEVDGNIYSAYGFDSTIRSRIMIMLKDLGIDTVMLGIEVLKPEKVCMYHKSDNEGYVLARSPVPEYRRQAMSVLQHFVFADTSAVYVSADPTGLTLETVVSLLDSVATRFDRGIIARTNFKFKINGREVYTIPVAPIILPQLLLDVHRFPTLDNSSRTPPDSPHFGRENTAMKEKSIQSGKAGKAKKDTVLPEDKMIEEESSGKKAC